MHALAASVWVTQTFNHPIPYGELLSATWVFLSLTFFRHLWWLLLQRSAVSSRFTGKCLRKMVRNKPAGRLSSGGALLLQRTHLFCFLYILFKQKWYILTFHHIYLMFWFNKFNMIYQYYIFKNVFNFILIVSNHFHQNIIQVKRLIK